MYYAAQSAFHFTHDARNVSFYPNCSLNIKKGESDTSCALCVKRNAFSVNIKHN